MIKYFHELTEQEWDKYIAENPHKTWKDAQKIFPQPKWCDYPEAVCGTMGCWSLMAFRVKDEDYCGDCDCHKKQRVEVGG